MEEDYQSYIEENLDPILGTLATIYAVNGDATKVTILVESIPSITFSDETWDNNQYYAEYILHLSLPVNIYASIKSKREQLEKDFHKELEVILNSKTTESIRAVSIGAQLRENSEWKVNAQKWLDGKGITNQGRVRSDNIASRLHDGLLFRSQVEINFYKSLKKLGVPFAPLPVFLKGGDSYKRIEPDFVIIKDGVMMIIEVDGANYHKESPAEAHERTTLLSYEGAHIERIKASEIGNIEKSDKIAKKIMQLIEKINRNK